MGYKYRLVKENGWRFELLPNNSNIQAVGKSGNYETMQEALDGMNRLKEFLLKKKFEEIEYAYEQTLPGSKTQYYGKFQFSRQGEMFYTTRYEQKGQVGKGIKRIVTNYNAEYRTALNKVML